MPSNPIRRLFQSRKAIVVMVVTSAVLFLVFREKTTFHDAADFLKWVLGPWLLAQGVEDAAKKMNERLPESPQVSSPEPQAQNPTNP